jgi:hypothetical protein
LQNLKWLGMKLEKFGGVEKTQDRVTYKITQFHIYLYIYSQNLKWLGMKLEKFGVDVKWSNLLLFIFFFFCGVGWSVFIVFLIFLRLFIF